MKPIEVRNWFGNITSSPRVVVKVHSVEEIIAVLKDRDRYPSPVRAVGSNHSTTACGVADGGTLIVMRGTDRIIEIRDDTVTAEAGALYIDVAQELQRRGLQFFVNVEIGNLTLGSAACSGTKDASMPGEFGQVSSYVQALKMVTPSGEILEITESDPELLQVVRSSYGLLGIVYEVSFRIRTLMAMQVHHRTYTIDELEQALPALLARDDSIMMYIDPFLDVIVVELRRYDRHGRTENLTDWQWRFRNYFWANVAPWFACVVSTYVRPVGLRDWFFSAFSRSTAVTLRLVVHGRRTLPTAQQIRYPDQSDKRRYTFSIWAFPQEDFAKRLRRYFAFARDYYRKHGYRVNLMSVGYRIRADRSSLFSYSFDGDVMTFDPVSTGNPGWEAFLRAYNELCIELGGTPLLNQTDFLTRAQAEKVFGDKIAVFQRYRQRFDPDDRLLNPYFKELLG